MQIFTQMLIISMYWNLSFTTFHADASAFIALTASGMQIALHI